MMMEEEGVVENSERYRLCVNALKGFMDDAGFSDVVIGLSGGMDSSLVAVMCADALGADRVHGVLMPGPYSTDHSVDDALDLARNLGIRTRTVSIAEPYRASSRACRGVRRQALGSGGREHASALPHGVPHGAVERIRLDAGEHGQQERGHDGVFHAVRRHGRRVRSYRRPVQTDVFAVARWRNRQAEIAGEVPPIPEHVFVKPPSAELSPDQEDEKSMGIDYPTLDRLLKAHVDRGLDAAALVSEGFDAADVERVLRTVRATAFKRALEPPCPDATFYE